MKEIELIYRIKSPVSHIGKSESTGAYFQRVKTPYEEIPVITGNAVRGQLRNCGAALLLDTLGVKVDKNVFHALFSGGNLGTTMKNDVGRALEIRRQFPLFSILGGAVGDMILAGKLHMGFVYPICRESVEITGRPSDVSWRKMLDIVEFTRMDDSKDDKLAKYIEDMEVENLGKASTMMRFAVQYLAPGVKMIQKIRIMTEDRLELGAFYSCFVRWLAHSPTIGGMSSRGFGEFEFEDTSFIDQDAVQEYLDYIKSFTPDFSLLTSKPKEKGKKNGPAKDNPAENNSMAD